MSTLQVSIINKYSITRVSRVYTISPLGLVDLLPVKDEVGSANETASNCHDNATKEYQTHKII